MVIIIHQISFFNIVALFLHNKNTDNFSKCWSVVFKKLKNIDFIFINNMKVIRYITFVSISKHDYLLRLLNCVTFQY